MVLHQRSVLLVPNLLSGAKNGLATGPMFAIAVTVVAKQKSDDQRPTPRDRSNI